MTEHRLLTGDSLHEPKGVETASSGQVYQSDGAGSGSWVNRLLGVFNLNRHYASGLIPDVSEPGSNFFSVLPQAASLTRFQGAMSGAITTAPAVLTIYKNGIAQTPTISISNTGSGAGVVRTATISPAISFNAGDTVEVRSDGASDTSASLAVTLTFTFTS